MATLLLILGLAADPGATVSAPAAGCGEPPYVQDFEFITDAVQREAAALKTKKIDWDAVVKEFRPRFAKCSSDVEHVRNVMELLATLRDSHTGVLDFKVPRDQLPGKFDGLFGGGLWFGWDQGKFVLRGIMTGHPLGTSIPLGSMLGAIDGEPAWLAMERERRRVAKFQGLSSEHSFFASLGNRLLPFGEKKELELEFLLPDGKTKSARVARWGPGGKAFYPGEAFLPPGLAWAEGAVATMLEPKGGPKTGYLKITGSMDGATAGAFHAAFDRLQGLEALILDGRGMGGGSDDRAWEMTGRFFPKGVDNGRHGRIAASGPWQFDGPVVMLQDELEVSSAETFTWALSETGRVISIGRPTGGWGIIPKRFRCPSGLVEFRLGVNDRATPIRGAHTEGVGWPPDLLVPFGPRFCELENPEQALGLEVLRILAAGFAVDETRAGFRALGDGDLAAFRAFGRKAAKAKGFDPERWAKLAADDLKAEIAMELAALRVDDDRPPDLLGAVRRLARIKGRAKGSGLLAEAAALEKAISAAKAEAAAEEALVALPDPRFAADAAAQKAYLAKHGSTKTGRFAREHLWK